jgi:hypothetical protein
MSLLASDKGKGFEPCPAGVQQAVCVDLIDNGLIAQDYGGKRKEVHKITLRWQIGDVSPLSGKRFTIQKRYTLSLNEKATLRKDLESWRGRPFTREELAGFDLELLLGANCQLAVVHSPGRKDPSQVFANVQTVMALGKGMERLTAEEYVREKDRPASNGPVVEQPEEDEVSF